MTFAFDSTGKVFVHDCTRVQSILIFEPAKSKTKIGFRHERDKFDCFPDEVALNATFTHHYGNRNSRGMDAPCASLNKGALARVDCHYGVPAGNLKTSASRSNSATLTV